VLSENRNGQNQQVVEADGVGRLSPGSRPLYTAAAARVIGSIASEAYSAAPTSAFFASEMRPDMSRGLHCFGEIFSRSITRFISESESSSS
jgi:hypothetical protein